MTTQWRDILVAYLHDPPDKALQIPGHEARARSYLQFVLGDNVSEAELKDRSDPLAAVAERLPAPYWKFCRVSSEDDALEIRHPLSGARQTLELGSWSQAKVRAAMQGLVAEPDNTQQRFLLAWRRLPELLSGECGEWFARLPADTRIPDHTIWQHLDTTAALKAAEAGSGANAAFLSFSLGPVQSFIAAARSLRDLWSGSMILAWLTFQGMLPIIDCLGPTALVYPAVRGLPWLDLWLRGTKHLAASIEPPKPKRLCAPCIPNRFLAVVPWGLDGSIARELADRCRLAAHEAWRGMSESVRASLQRAWKSAPPDWDRRWAEQIEHHFDVRTAVLPWQAANNDEEVGRLIAGEGGFAAAFPHADAVRSLADAIPVEQRPDYPQQPSGYPQKSAGSWQAKVELSARLMQSQRAVRHVPPSTEPKTEGEQFPPKCSLFGSYEQMGPGGLADSRKFWEQAAASWSTAGVRLRAQEQLSAVALVKRGASKYFAKALDLDLDDLTYADTATVAAAKWLEHAKLDPREIRRRHPENRWSGQWLHWPNPEFDPGDSCPADIWDTIRDAARRSESKPPAYYAVIMMDGDNMGGWLRGDHSPKVREIMHLELVSYYERLARRSECPAEDRRRVEEGLNARRPVGPALHAAISEALANFALHFVPHIVEQHSGTLIYAGGDDVLALLPAQTALACASQLRETFRKNWERDAGGRERLLMGRRATVSAGLAVVHYKEDLRFALETARKAEKAAKNAGRDALQITVCRRSGEHATALCPWEFAGEVDRWVQIFTRDASDRWAYHLREEAETLSALDVGAMQAEIQRQIGRAEQLTKRLFGEGQENKDAAGRRLVAAFDEYRSATKPPPADDQPPQRRFATDGEAFSQFITLCQTASFLARGRDE